MAQYNPQDLYSWEYRGDRDGWESFIFGNQRIWVDMPSACKIAGIEFGNANLAFRWMVDTNFGKYHPPMTNDLYKG